MTELSVEYRALTDQQFEHYRELAATASALVQGGVRQIHMAAQWAPPRRRAVPQRIALAHGACEIPVDLEDGADAADDEGPADLDEDARVLD